jgi:signal transduction histidine kinase
MTQNTIYFLTGLILALLSLAVIVLFFRAGRRWWHLFINKSPIDYGFLSVKFGRQLTTSTTQTEIAQVLTQDLIAELGASRSVLLLADDTQLRPLGNEDLALPINYAAVRWVTASGEAQKSNRGRLQDLIEQGRIDLSWTKVWVPLMRGANLEGLWLLGERGSGVQYSREDIQWLTSLAREAAAVLEAMKFAEQERQVASEMRALYRQLIIAREDERSRLSRELHDGVLQDLCAVVRDIKRLQNNIESDDEFLNYLVDLSNDTVQDLRAICNDLRPPLLQHDITTALKTLIQELDVRSPAPVHIQISTPKNELRLPDDKALTIFRITQEATNNAIQHAEASEISVRLNEYPDKLRLTITDDGRGIDGGLGSARFVAAGHYGIAGMRERAAMVGGSLEVQSSLDYGTVVILELPFEVD